MSSKAQHVPDNSVIERRLRPIYEWLDIGNNKKALQECEKVLKKNPHLQCAKALKALTLFRIGRASDAGALLDALVAEAPTDDATLQAITLSYRETQQLDKICQLYETAVGAEPGNEELCTHLFMSYARVFDYKAQQKAAMALYRQTPKTPYYCWAVMSVVLQATRGEGRADAPKRQLLFSLAQRMLEKLVAEGKLEAEQEIQLYVLVLELQAKWARIVEIYDGELGARLACSNQAQNRLKYLIRMGKWALVNRLARGILVDCVDRWDVWKEYVRSVFELDGNEMEACDDSPEKCHEFICRIIESGGPVSGDKERNAPSSELRGAYLARFELCKRLDADYRDLLGEKIELFVEYFRKFGHKSCCVSDLRIYLNLLSADERLILAERLLEQVADIIKPNCVPEMQKHLSALQLARLCGAHARAGYNRADLVRSLAERYEYACTAFGADLLSTDLGPGDAYVLIGVHLLYDMAVEANEPRFVFGGLVLLHSLLRRSPSNFHAKLLAIRLYHTIGGTLGANYWCNNLDIKHLQLDSLGFIHCARLATTGIYSLSGFVFDLTLKFFSSSYKESSDHITLSYKYGSFIKLNEFMDFRERLNNSLHYTTVVIDRIFLNLIECSNLDNLFTIDISLKDDHIDWDLIRDNHDLSVFVSWDPKRIDGTPETYPEIAELRHQNIKYLKLKSSLIWSMGACIEIAKSTDDNDRLKHLDQLKTIKINWENDWNEFSKASQPLRQDLATLPLPSRLHCLLDTPFFPVLADLIDIFAALASNEVSAISERISQIEVSLANMLNKIEAKTKVNGSNLFQRRETLESVTNVVEIMSMACLLCLLCNELLKPGQGKKSRKKSEGVSLRFAISPIAGVKDAIAKLSDLLKNETIRFSNIVENWTNAIEFNDLTILLESMGLKSNNDVDEKLVTSNVTESYASAGKDILSVLKQKIKMFN